MCQIQCNNKRRPWNLLCPFLVVPSVYIDAIVENNARKHCACHHERTRGLQPTPQQPNPPPPFSPPPPPPPPPLPKKKKKKIEPHLAVKAGSRIPRRRSPGGRGEGGGGRKGETTWAR